MSQYLDYGMLGGGISTNEYSKHLDDNQKVPTQKRNLQLYHWISRQKKLLHEGCLPKERRDPLEKLLARIDSIRERQAVVANSTWTATPTGERESLNCTLAASDACQAERVERQPARQDDLWKQKWRAYMDYMEKYKTSPVKTSRRGLSTVRLVQAQQETAQAGPDEDRAYYQVQTAA